MTDRIREEFEKWRKLNGYEPLPSYDMDKNPNKQCRGNVWHAFDGFQAAYNLREQEIQRLKETKDCFYNLYEKTAEEVIKLKNYVAPLLGLMPFKSTSGQIIWAESKNRADSIFAGQSIFKILDEVFEQALQQDSTKE